MKAETVSQRQFKKCVPKGNKNTCFPTTSSAESHCSNSQRAGGLRAPDALTAIT